MAKLKLRGKDLIGIGYPEGKVIGVALNLVLKHYKRSSKEEILLLLEEVLANPSGFEKDETLGRIAEELKVLAMPAKREAVLHVNPMEYHAFGRKDVEPGAIQQMETAMRLPVTIAGALLPDAHQGYGLPIGGVLAVENAVIPYGVGMDIGCRMCLSVYNLKPSLLEATSDRFKNMLVDHTRFGFDTFDRPMDDEVLQRPEFKEIPRLRSLHQKAREQIGTSGSGNHFVEFGVVVISDPVNEFGLPCGQFLGLLSHSGSRGMGAGIAQYYTKIAMEQCLLPAEAKHLAWLDLDSQAGAEYWLAMNLAGDYASACHHHIHHRISRALGENPLAKVENHHNFAWKENLIDGRKAIVHRKGATPAGKGVLGIIPGSMTAPGFIVRGKGQALSLNSASHGAGRTMSRRKAKESITFNELRSHLKTAGVELIGGGVDEAPFAYKDIHKVMGYQRELVEVIGTFLPKIVRMAHN